MKIRIRILITILLSVSISVTGCSAKSALREKDTKEEESIQDKKKAKNEVQIETENDEQENLKSEKEEADTRFRGDDMIYKGIVLTSRENPQKVCIAVEPSVLRIYNSYYYTPDDRDQEWLQQYINTMEIEGKPYDEKRKYLEEKGWQIVYGEKRFIAFEEGYLQYTYLDERGRVMECFVEAPKLCDYIQIMLEEKLDYTQFHPTDIKNIISAKLDVHSASTNKEFYSQTITDEETLKMFEDWFSHGVYIYGGADCGNQDACLELVLGNKKVVRLSVATDSCPNYGVNGVYYDYRPTTVWDNREFFEQFDEIPWNWDIGI